MASSLLIRKAPGTHDRAWWAAGFQMTNSVILGKWGAAKKGPQDPWRRRQKVRDTAWNRNETAGANRTINLGERISQPCSIRTAAATMLESLKPPYAARS